MKKLILLLALIIFSCSPKDELENIEIMTYYYVHNKVQTKLIVDLDDYSKLDADGNVYSIKRIKPYESNYIYLKSEINPKLITELAEINKNRNDEFYKTKIDTNYIDIYDGPIIRVLIKYKNKKTISFTYQENETDSKYSLFLKTQKVILNNYNKNRYQIIDSVSIKQSQKEFENFALGKDTLELPMPPRSVTEDVKFPPPNK